MPRSTPLTTATRSAPTTEMLTRCGRPAAVAAATRVRARSPSPLALPARWTIVLTPRTASATPAPVARSPRTSSKPSAAGRSLRLRTRTRAPACCSRGTTSRPRLPAPPVTRMVFIGSPSGLGHIREVPRVYPDDPRLERNVTPVDEATWLTERFEEQRSRLRSMAYRMLGSGSEADDAVQDAWLRVSRADTREVDNLNAWLTTVVARVCLNMLRRRTTRREVPLENAGAAVTTSRSAGGDPEEEALLAGSVGLALLVVLDTLTPAERLAFVLHYTFGLPFEEIAPMVGRSPAAEGKLACRARRRVRGDFGALVACSTPTSSSAPMEGHGAPTSPESSMAQ